MISLRLKNQLPRYPLSSIRTMSSSKSVKESTTVKPMYRFEATLPKLPVPTLEETAAKYLKSIKPYHIAQNPTSSAEALSSFKASESAVNEFLTSPLVKELQTRLVKRSEEKDSWLSEWWNEYAYFGYRGPNVPGVNYYYSHKDDKSRKTGTSRAAGLTRALLYFRKMTESEILEPEMARTTPLCMASYKYLFNASRLPTAPSDTARKYDPATHNHVVVIRNNKFYEVPIVDSTGEFLSESELEVLFNQVVVMAGDHVDPHPVGALTSADRDDWTVARQQIVAHAAGNATSLERIESAIIVIALDSTKPVTREETSWGLWVGDGKNRFFDKHQLICFENGKSGFNGEHSCMDGTPTSRLNDWLLRSLQENKIPLGSPTPRPLSALPSVTPITFSLPPTAVAAIDSAMVAHQEIMSKNQLAVLQYDGYGKDAIKKFKLSPDSYTQLVMALAYYKMKGVIAPVYESAQTRKYKLGRTEVIRSATVEALEWVKMMENPNKTDEERLVSLQKAGAVHAQLAKEAADGHGVDRHLFGLKKSLKEGEKIPSLYVDPTFAQSSHWILSTSQLTSEFFEGWGYGPVVGDGYGLAYAVNARSLRFTITSENTGAEGVLQFRQYLEEACNEVREVMENGLAQQAAGKPKL